MKQDTNPEDLVQTTDINPEESKRAYNNLQGVYLEKSFKSRRQGHDYLESLEERIYACESKTSIWKRFFRRGYNTKRAHYNGWSAKTDANTSRARLYRKLDRFLQDKTDDH